MTPEDYRRKIRELYHTRRTDVLVSKRRIVTVAEIRNALLKMLDRELSELDNLIIQRYFNLNRNVRLTKEKIEENLSTYITISRFLTKEVGSTNMGAIDLLALLIDFQPRPFDFKSLTKDAQQNYIKQEKANNFSKNDFIANKIKDYSEIIDEILPAFVGRKFVFDRIDDFVRKNPKGYFYIRANPGIGKTSLSIKLAEKSNYPFHIINPQHNGSDYSVKDFISNICAQLISKYNLPFERFPEDYDQDGAFLFAVLRAVSKTIEKEEKVVIIVDGLDELKQEELTFFAKENILYLPELLPQNIFFVLTMRDLSKKGIRFPKEISDEYLIEEQGEDNIKDVREYIEIVSYDKRFEHYIEKHNLSKKEFLQTLEKKSEGNFMYLKYIFREILNGRYKDIKLSELPQGLDGYYKEHWDRMMTEADGISEDVKLKTIYVMANIDEPISSEDLTEIIQSDDETVKNRDVRKIINDWWQFLRETINNEDGEKEYTFYHKSFLDFLASDDIIETVGKDYSKIAQRVELDFYEKNIDPFLSDEDIF